MTNTDEFLSLAQVAASLGVSSESVRRKIASGDLAAIKLGLGPSPLRIAPQTAPVFGKLLDEAADLIEATEENVRRCEKALNDR